MSKKIYPKIIGKCQYCKGDIIATYSGLNKPDRKYCSIGCSTTVKNKKMVWTDERRKKNAIACSKRFKGIKNSDETRLRKSLAIRGKKHWNWQGGITATHFKERSNLKLKEWRRQVFARDNYTCQKCNSRSQKGCNVYLEAHHIKSWAKYPELRYDLNNGLTLCKDCHKLTDNYKGKTK